MKLLLDNLPWKTPIRAAATHAFTLAELMTTMAVFAMVVLAMVSLQVFGFKMNSLTSSKLQYTAYSLKALDQICNQVRGATLVQVGNWDGTSFTTSPSGNALQIYPTADMTTYTRFYLDANTANFYRVDIAGNNNISTVIAANVVNLTAVFQVQDYQGNPLANNQEHFTILLTLQFQPLAYTVPTTTYDYYTLQTLMTPRNQY
jgi:hypothetical protein